MDFTQLKCLRLNEVIEVTTLSKSRIYDLMSQGKFPRNVNCGGRTALWRYEHILEWVNLTFAPVTVKG